MAKVDATTDKQDEALADKVKFRVNVFRSMTLFQSIGLVSQCLTFQCSLLTVTCSPFPVFPVPRSLLTVHFSTQAWRGIIPDASVVPRGEVRLQVRRGAQRTGDALVAGRQGQVGGRGGWEWGQRGQCGVCGVGGKGGGGAGYWGGVQSPGAGVEGEGLHEGGPRQVCVRHVHRFISLQFRSARCTLRSSVHTQL